MADVEQEAKDRAKELWAQVGEYVEQVILGTDPLDDVRAVVARAFLDGYLRGEEHMQRIWEQARSSDARDTRDTIEDSGIIVPN